MSRPLNADRALPPTKGVPQSWTALAEPFTAPNGLTVSFPDSVEKLFAVGDHFVNALELRRYAEMFAGAVVRGEIHIYTVSGPEGLLSCGELKVRDGTVRVFQDRAMRNGPGTPETGAAVAAFAEAVNEGTVETNLAVGQDGFEPKPPGPTP